MKRRLNTIVLRLFFVLIAACVFLPGRAAAQGISCAGVPNSIVGAVTWTPLFCQEFNAATPGPPDPAVWSFEIGDGCPNNCGWGNHELELYCGPPGTSGNPTPCANSFNTTTNNSYVDGAGHLVIQAIKNAGTWTSARLKTENLATYTYGRIEAREQLPVGNGMWPAFWGLGLNIANVGWPNCGEIDFMEHVPSMGSTMVQSTIHGGISSGNCYCGSNGLGKRTAVLSGDVTGFHVYGAIWSANLIQFYVDDPSKVFFVRTPSDVPAGQPWVFNHPFFLLTNLAVGGDFPGPPDSTTPSPSVMLVDYVRQYTPSTIPAPNLPSNPPPIAVKAGSVTGNTSTFTPVLTNGTGFVYFSCSTNAPKATCAISTNDPLNSFVVNSNATEQVTVKATTTANALLPPFRFTPRMRFTVPFVIAALLFLMALLIARGSDGERRWRRNLALMSLAFTGVLLAACGGGGSNAPPPPPPSGGTPPGSYTITVNAFTMGNTTGTPDATTSVLLTVN